MYQNGAKHRLNDVIPPPSHCLVDARIHVSRACFCEWRWQLVRFISPKVEVRCGTKCLKQFELSSACLDMVHSAHKYPSIFLYYYTESWSQSLPSISSMTEPLGIRGQRFSPSLCALPCSCSSIVRLAPKLAPFRTTACQSQAITLCRWVAIPPTIKRARHQHQKMILHRQKEIPELSYNIKSIATGRDMPVCAERQVNLSSRTRSS